MSTFEFELLAPDCRQSFEEIVKASNGRYQREAESLRYRVEIPTPAETRWFVNQLSLSALVKPLEKPPIVESQLTLA